MNMMITPIQELSRREALARTGLALAAAWASGGAAPAAVAAEAIPPLDQGTFTFALNTGTLRGQKLGLAKEIEIVARAGYQGIEPWVEEIDQYAKSGGSLPDLRKRLGDSGLTVEGAIGFPEWIVDDDAKRAKGLERAKYEMDLVGQLGGRRLAAPPAGATSVPGLEPMKAAERYRALLELGDQMGVVPQLELWGFSKNLNRLGQCLAVAMETGHPKACVLADVFHLYKGGSPFEGLRLASGSAIQVFHMNDYPADPPRDKINDSFRIYPGDGIAPLAQILRDLRGTGGRKVLSLELFNRQYWQQDASEVAKNGLMKMKAALQKTLA
jgi:sugar phosphate isomerase/epimerase